jgi:hypothetical protein
MTTEIPGLRVKGYLMSSQLFSRGFATGHGPCACSSVCCEGGVYADVLERDTILAHKDVVRKYMDESQPLDEAGWFDAESHEDPDFRSGHCIGTEVYNNKCVFLDKLGRCSLQAAAAGEGKHRWAIKPLYCILFPIEISSGVVSFDDLLQGEENCCSTSAEFEVPLFRGCKDELVHLVGEDGYRQMEEHYERARNLTKVAGNR